MKEKILKGKKNGFVMLILFLCLYARALLLTIFSAIAVDRSQEFWGVANPLSILCLILGIVWLSLGWIPFCGLKVLRPQEALLLTLFGKYIGTLKEEGFYYVNPFCSSVNPASKTKLNQNGDVKTTSPAQAAANSASAADGKGVVELDEERKAAMVSNLLVVLCGNHDTQPIVNTGSLY